MRPNIVTLSVKTGFNSTSEMDYNLRGAISQKEVDDLKLEFHPIDFRNYNGAYKILYAYPGLEVLIHLLEKYNGELLKEIQDLLFPKCAEVFPYQLDDGRVAVVNMGSTYFYKNQNEFLTKQRIQNILFKKKIATKDFPINRIEYLPGNKKINYLQIDPNIGEIFKNAYPLFEQQAHSHTGSLLTHELPDDKIYEFHTIFETHHLFNRSDYLLLQEKRKLHAEISQAQNRGTLSDYGFVNATMCGRNPYGEKFVENIDKLINDLKSLLDLDDEHFDYSIENVVRIENRIFSKLITDAYVDELFLPLMAFVGNYFVHNLYGEWKLFHDKTFDSWVPDILLNGNSPIQLYYKIYINLDPRNSEIEFNDKLNYFLRTS